MQTIFAESRTAPAADGAPSVNVTVQQILDRRVPLEWFEGVAIVAGLCAALGEQTGIPSADQVVVTPAGEVAVPGMRSRSLSFAALGPSEERATALPRLLDALLEGTQAPAPLRMFVKHTISSEAHPSPRSFGAALEYYERPGRDELVQSVYRRFLETPPPAPAERETAAPPPDRVVEETPVDPAPRSRRATRRVVVLAGVAGVVAVPLLLVAAPWRDAAPSSGEPPRGLRGVVTRVRDAAAAVVADALKTSAPAPAVESVAPPEAVPAPVRVVRARRLDAALAAGEEAMVAIDMPERAAAGAVALEPPAAESEVFSAEETGVTAPVLLDPVRLPASLTSGGPGGHAIELLINEAGTVDRVQLLSPSSHMTDMMLLSAAKTWRFDPARRNGTPVKYRVRLNWVTR